MKYIVYFFFFFSSVSCHFANDSTKIQNEYHIIPQPLVIQAEKGTFQLDENMAIFVSDSSLKQVANFLEWGKVQVTNTTKLIEARKAIIFQLDKNMTDQNAYKLSVKPQNITVSSSAPQGVFYAIQTIKQLTKNKQVPCVEIEDKPRFSYRGMHLDVARHFFPVATIKKYIDALAYHKFNRFHWHLTDDQGWRIEIKKYPKLNEVAAFRKETLVGHARNKPEVFDGQTYGGFYTQEEVKEIVQYAADRFITVIPEIEMPGHSQAVLAAYPELACTEGPFETATKWGVFHDVLCPKEATFTFLEEVLIEVMNLFPSEYIHIGGDECLKTRWEQSTFCQNLIKKEGLKDEQELQSYFIKRIEKFLNSKGRNIIGWDEILEGGLATNASVMSWRGIEGGVAAAQQGHDMVMTPTSHCYFDYYQSLSAEEPLAIGGFLPVQKVYEYEPIPEELTQTEVKHILGVQGNIWTEYITTPEQLFYMAFPRTCALAEVAWSSVQVKDYQDFAERLITHLDRLEAMGIRSANHLYEVKLNVENHPTKELTATLTKAVKQGVIRYTLNGTAPNSKNIIYEKAISIDKTLVLKAQSFLQEQAMGYVTKQEFNWHKAVHKTIKFEHLPHKKYGGNGVDVALNSILASSERFNDSEWLGFSGTDAIAVIDFGEQMTIQQVKTRFFKGEAYWIYLPKALEVEYSNDGKIFQSLAMTKTIDTKNTLLNFPPTQVRFLKIKATNFGTIPIGAAGAGHKAWLFLDEIMVN